jgi:N-6 DNA Methylase
MKRRKADDEHLIRKALLDARLIDAVISLPINVFYGAGVPACLLILRKQRPPERRDQVLLIYAARHYRELSGSADLSRRRCRRHKPPFSNGFWSPTRTIGADRRRGHGPGGFG